MLTRNCLIIDTKSYLSTNVLIFFQAITNGEVKNSILLIVGILAWFELRSRYLMLELYWIDFELYFFLIWLWKFIVTKSALSRFIMPLKVNTILSSMIWLHSASSTESLLTLSAFNSMLRHVDSSLRRNCLT